MGDLDGRGNILRHWKEENSSCPGLVKTWGRGHIHKQKTHESICQPGIRQGADNGTPCGQWADRKI
ncbi:hypothetical protein PITCH_A220036 [uncultured Desulfobacterium sp.]|uniref:Uncharacterized protein n=1 Tax=uncultured Desulfobacterium sp. TaxID=201089 RepID=A0A445MXX5_9BACT|nr:hypothetical protein PITCH_A220036 [uncultured Desulfobacterium sp.]